MQEYETVIQPADVVGQQIDQIPRWCLSGCFLRHTQGLPVDCRTAGNSHPGTDQSLPQIGMVITEASQQCEQYQQPRQPMGIVPRVFDKVGCACQLALFGGAVLLFEVIVSLITADTVIYE